MKWQPIETAPKDKLILVGRTKRMDMCTAVNHSQDGWVTETPAEWVSIYTPSHWMPLPAAPDAKCRTCSGHGAVGNILTAEPCPDCTPAAAGAPDIDRAAKKLAELLDYPWDHMPTEGRQNMRKNAEAVLLAAGIKDSP